MAAGTMMATEREYGKGRGLRSGQQIWGADRRQWAGTPEIYFPKAIDNSRLVKVADPRRAREMRQFTLVVVALFALVMVYAWQHFSSVEYGYRIEALKSERDSLAEMNRALRLEQASLRDPERIDALAREIGLQTPAAGQVIRMQGAGDIGGPVLARADVVVVTASR